jgi:4-hydroxy-tetrahydrodipicolinate reductase
MTPDSRLSMRIAIIGNGKMGKAVAALAEERGHTVHTVIARAENVNGRALTAERLSGVDVALEFTRPDAVVTNVERLLELGLPTVTGTTGWSGDLPRITSLVRQKGGALLHAANFSAGMQLFFRAARELARGFHGHPEFTAAILEEHHQTKLDSPSGTALELQRQLQQEEPGRGFPITSKRSGDSPGVHMLTYEGRHETVALKHVARSRQAFAAGALDAAEWLPGRVGVFTYHDVLFGSAG